ncbi:MAG TPA: tetratricopeptide repeat protein [Isosphaeraceae bacterium]|nr:tetratricopeptide repeat protein [Isosphaeraceae bacterium]
MKFRPNHTLRRAMIHPSRPWQWSAVNRSLLALLALALGGCVAMSRPADQPQDEPAAGAQNDSKTAMPNQARVSDPKTQFQEKATDRQRFQVHIDFGRVFETQGNIDAAILEYQDALAVVQSKRRGTLHPADEALAHRRIGGALDRQGRFAQAETHYKKALKMSPKDPKIWNDAGYSYYLQGRWNDAERALKTATRLSPDDDRIRTNLGLTLAAAGRTDEALPLLSKSDGDAIGHANLGYLLAASGQVDLARRQYERALALRPDLQLARRALEKLDLQERSSQSPGAPNVGVAQATRSTAYPIDAHVTQASTSGVKIPSPVAGDLVPVAKAAAVHTGQPELSSSTTSPSSSDLPLPPPL